MPDKLVWRWPCPHVFFLALFSFSSKLGQALGCRAEHYIWIQAYAFMLQTSTLSATVTWCANPILQTPVLCVHKTHHGILHRTFNYEINILLKFGQIMIFYTMTGSCWKYTGTLKCMVLFQSLIYISQIPKKLKVHPSLKFQKFTLWTSKNEFHWSNLHLYRSFLNRHIKSQSFCKSI